jgi:hypothetical protein
MDDKTQEANFNRLMDFVERQRQIKKGELFNILVEGVVDLETKDDLRAIWSYGLISVDQYLQLINILES